MSDYLDLFIEESSENLDELEKGLIELEDLTGSESLAKIRDLFRFAHNLKGMAATVGQDGITRLAHSMEDLLDLYRNEVARPDSEAIDALLAGTDNLGSMLGEVPSGTVPPAPDDLLATLEAKIRSLQGAESGASTGVVDAVDADPRPERSDDPVVPAPTAGSDIHVPEGATAFTVTLVEGCALAGARAAIALNVVNAAGTILETIPDRDTIFEGRTFEFTVVAEVADPAAAAAKLTAVTDVASVSTVAGSDIDDADDPVDGNAPAGDGGPAVRSAGAAPQRATVRVEVDRLDDLMNLVGELVIGRGQLEQRARNLGDRPLGDVVNTLGRTISDLQSAVARARMLTLDGTFNRLKRLVRDTSKDLGKEIDFVMTGGETELDRSMIDKVADPLVHLLRNALDHGIEDDAGARIAAGKPRAGSIALSAETQGNQVVITIADDGGGIDSERVAAKALDKGIVSKEQLSVMSLEDKQNLIFLPGFSTKEVASSVSGRGVGMDVVRTSVNELGGNVEVTSTEGEGSVFRITLPLSLAVLDVLLVTITGQTWAIPLQHVEETINVADEDLGGVLGRPVVALRGETIGVIHGSRVIGHAEPVSTPFQAVVFRHRTDRWALSVDALLEQAEVVVKPSPDELADVPHVAGATILGDGRVSMILDLAAVVTNLTRESLRNVS